MSWYAFDFKNITPGEMTGGFCLIHVSSIDFQLAYFHNMTHPQY